MPEWLVDEQGVAAVGDKALLLEAERAMNELLSESIADLELALEDRGWDLIGRQQDDFTGKARKKAAALGRVMAMANPLIKRGLGLRVAYVWGQGVQISVRDDGDEGQDVNAVVQQFLDDNEATFSDSPARAEMEHQLGTDGEVFLALPTNAVTGEVNVRQIDPAEITDVITDPEDSATVRYYRRDYVPKGNDGTPGKQQTVFYPALSYRPRLRPRAVQDRSGQIVGEIRWDAPMRAVQVNKPTRGTRGIGDAYAALPWARADKEFLEDWAMLMKALSSIAFQVKTKASKAQQAARTASTRAAVAGNPSGAGATVGMDADSSIEAVPKTGAVIDADSHRPLATFAAAALGVSVSMLLGDTGKDGSRAAEQTLDQPTELEMGLRRKVWTSVHRDVCGYVIDAAVKAPAGPLRGTVLRRGDREIIELPVTDDRTVQVTWPPYDSIPIETLVKAIADADATERVPPLIIARLLMEALGVEDLDDILDELTDDDGQWIPFDVADAQVRGRLADRGEADAA